MSAADDLSDTRSILAEAGIDCAPEAGAEVSEESANLPAATETVIAGEPQETSAAHPEAEDLKFGWAYPNTASADDLIIGSDGTGYLYPSDFAHGTNGYEPD